MPHPRDRLILAKLKKRLTFFPVVAMQGARQTGKSFLARQLAPKALPKAQYVTFDDRDKRSAAEAHPASFLKEHLDAMPLILDEAQKVPDIFDAVKSEVDEERRPGRFPLPGFDRILEIDADSRIADGPDGARAPLPVYASRGGWRGKASLTRSHTMQYLKAGEMPLFSLYAMWRAIRALSGLD